MQGTTGEYSLDGWGTIDVWLQWRDDGVLEVHPLTMAGIAIVHEYQHKQTGEEPFFTQGYAPYHPAAAVELLEYMDRLVVAGPALTDGDREVRTIINQT